jgi:hypothetical protein
MTFEAAEVHLLCGNLNRNIDAGEWSMYIFYFACIKFRSILIMVVVHEFS